MVDLICRASQSLALCVCNLVVSDDTTTFILMYSYRLPDSPPYSGSEAYSPDSNKLLSPSACSGEFRLGGVAGQRRYLYVTGLLDLM